MDNKVLDEAVEVALALRPFHPDKVTVGEYLHGFDDEDREQFVRSIILAALPVLLGEPVAWQFRPKGMNWIQCDRDEYKQIKANGHRARELYAPSLGEGDGR